jgi:spermidine synthase
MIGQIIILREFIVVFYGNELSLGVILATWLFWVAFGSAVLGRITDRLGSKQKLLSYSQILLSFILPLNILLIRNIKSFMGISPGEIVGLAPIFMSSFLSLFLACSLLGFTFTLISKLAAERSVMPSKAITLIYLLEGLGASIGGLLYSFFLVKSFSPVQNALIAGSFSMATSALFSKNLFHLIYLVIILTPFIFNWPGFVDTLSRRIQYAPFKMIESSDSIYGNITVTKTGKEFSFYENGVLLFTSGDLATSEESVHYAMLEHPAPKKILLIGGGVGGSAEQILKHHVEKIDYVEFDPLIVSLAGKYLPPLKDERVNIIHGDGRFFVKQLSLNNTYDIIILDLPDPHTAMMNRFYSLEFFREIKKILAQGGVFSFSLSSSENYINPENALYLGCIYHTLEKVFSEIKIFPGNNVIFLAADKKNALTYDTNILIKRLRDRKLNLKFVREYYMPFKLNPLRIKYVESVIKESGAKKINLDFRPIGYFYNMLLWLTLFKSGKGFLAYLGIINIYFFIGLNVLLFAAFLLAKKISKASFKMPVVLSVGTTGLSEIAFQLVVILAFQSIYGYLYYKIGFILTFFMIGLVAGSAVINRQLERIRDERSLYIKTQMVICIYPLILPLMLGLASKTSAANQSFEMIFAFLPMIAGFLGGFQFPLANKICLKTAKNAGRTTGLLYGVDLFGACIGGLLIGLFFIPVLGIIQTCVLLSVINVLALALLFIQRAERY